MLAVFGVLSLADWWQVIIHCKLLLRLQRTKALRLNSGYKYFFLLKLSEKYFSLLAKPKVEGISLRHAKK